MLRKVLNSRRSFFTTLLFGHSSIWWPTEEPQLNSRCFCPADPEEGALSPSSSSHTEEQGMDAVTVTTAYLSQQRGDGGGERRRRPRREGENKQRTGGRGGGGSGPPDLDLDQVEEEAQEEERRRSQTVRQKEKRDGQREHGNGSRSLPRNGARSWDTSPPERLEEEPGAGARERKRRSGAQSRRRPAEAGREEKKEERKGSSAPHPKHSGGSAPAQRSAFSFLRPMDDSDEERRSDGESANSFSEVSQSAASVATAGWREDSDWRAESPWEQEKVPGPWLKPSPQRLTQVLVGSRLRGRELVGGLSL